MDNFLEKLKNLKNIQLGGKATNKANISTGPKVIKEINLVPDIKNDFIKTLKFRNLVFFLCIVVASGSVIVILIFLTITGGQQGFITAKQNTIDALQQKISDYSDLSDFLTIRDQLGNISSIIENKTLASRTFNVLSAIIPTGADTVTISELTITLSGEEVESPYFTIEGQANAGTPPYLNYRVLDSFVKSMSYMRYDYGEYVDKNDQTIPAYCMIETGTDGSTLRDSSRGYYAYWLIEGEGCNPSAEDEEDEEETEEKNTSSSSTSLWNQIFGEDTNSENQEATTETESTTTTPTEISGYPIEQYEGQNVVRIWRTPQYTDWYKANPKENEAYMDLDGTIHNVAHFNSSCISYSGEENDDKTITWTTTNESCLLVPEPEDDEGGIVINDSSNGRDDEEKLVLRFNATITFAPEVFNFNKHHLMAIPPSGRHNVTDSYVQIQSIFAKRADNCEQDDTVCINAPTNSTSDTTNNTNNNSTNDNLEDEEDI